MSLWLAPPPLLSLSSLSSGDIDTAAAKTGPRKVPARPNHGRVGRSRHFSAPETWDYPSDNRESVQVLFLVGWPTMKSPFIDAPRAEAGCGGMKYSVVSGITDGASRGQNYAS